MGLSVMNTFTKAVAARFTNDLPFEDVELSAATRGVVRHLEQYALDYFGPRCDDYAAACACCKMWKHVDAVKAHVAYCCE